MPGTGRTARAALALALLLGVMAPGCAPADESGANPPDASAPAPAQDAMTITSTALQDAGRVPARYCNTGVAGGKNVSPPLQWTPVAGARSYALIIVDRHRVASDWVHWAVADMGPETTSLAEGASGRLPAPARELRNTFGTAGYGGPQPPSGSGDHPYEIAVYALDQAAIEIPQPATAAGFEAAVRGHVIATSAMTVYFGR